MKVVLTAVLLAASGDPAGFTVAPPSAWVEVRPLEAVVPLPPNELEDGIQLLVSETQLKVNAGSVERYSRLARRLASPVGVERGAQLTFHFEPSYQRLVIHGIWIQRGDQRIDALVPAEVKVIQQERDLEARIYNGTLTALVAVKDVREGDLLEAAWSTVGENEIFAGTFATRLYLEEASRVGRILRRLVYPAGRPLFFTRHQTSLEPQKTEADGFVDYRWELKDVRPVVYEDRLPPHFEPWPSVQVSTFADWGEVARWAAELFKPEASADGGTAGGQALDQLAEGWKKLPTPEARLLAATRFVQDDIRYFGVEIGANTHRPHAPAMVLAQRYGDCKDKALLLVELLGRLGIEATPALVSARRHRGVEKDHPTPFAFDHAIVRARLGEREHWIDATRSLERGALALRPPPDFERALLVDPRATALVNIPTPRLESPTIDVLEQWEVSATGRGTLSVRSTYRGDEALGIRHVLAANSKGELERHALNRHARGDSSFRLARPLEVNDDPEANTVEVITRYAFDAFWRNGEPHPLYPTSFDDVLAQPSVAIRNLPLAIEPAWRHHRIEVRLPSAAPVPELLEVRGPAIEGRFEASATHNDLALDFTYRTTADLVEPADLNKHLEALSQLRNAGYDVRSVFAKGTDFTPESKRRNLIISGVFGGFLALLFLGSMLQQRRAARSGQSPRRRSRH